jgi:hypothetical protein
MEGLKFVLTIGDLGCFSSTLDGESDPLIVPRLLLPKIDSGILGAGGDISSGVGSSGAGIGGRELGFGEIGGVIEGTGGICVRDGTSITRGNAAVNGLKRENVSENLLEPAHSTGDLIAVMLAGEAGELSTKTGDEGAEDTRLIALFCGKTVMPHLLVGRAGAGVSSGGVTGEPGSNGGEGSGTASSTDF